MTRVICILLLLQSICFAASKGQQLNPERVTLTREGQQWVEQTLRGLSLEEKVGQMLQVRYFGDYENFDSDPYRQLHDELQKYHIGSVVLGLHVDASGLVKDSPIAAATITNQLQRDSKLPLLVAADLERGVASRFNDVPSFPWPMAFGAVGDLNEVERFGAITAREARAVGVQWALAPVADVNSNPANPIINTRSFGEDPEAVGNMVAAFIRGAHKNGMLVTAKHFPGHGDSAIDSHRGVPVIGGDLAHLQTIEFPPFKKAIAANVDSVLLAHARVPAIEPDPNRIATLSPNIVNGLLKGQLGFKGVVVTDALEMRSVTMLYGPHEANPTARAAVDAIKAGDDVITLPKDLDAAFEGILRAIRNGEIPESRIDESVRKILNMKASVGLNKSRFVDLDRVSDLVNKPEDTAFAQHVADQAMTLVRNNGQVLPLEELQAGPPKSGPEAGPNHRVLVILIPEAHNSSSGHEFEKAFKARRPDADILYVDNRVVSVMRPEIMKAVNDVGKVVIAAYVVHSAARQLVVGGMVVNSFGLLGPTGQLLEEVLAVAPEKTAVIAMESPYLIENFPQIQTYMCTYAMAPTSEISSVKALFGELQSPGRLPVTLPGVAIKGFSMRWPSAQKKR